MIRDVQVYGEHCAVTVQTDYVDRELVKSSDYGTASHDVLQILIDKAYASLFREPRTDPASKSQDRDWRSG